MYVYIYIYIERERDIIIHNIYIYIYIHTLYIAPGSCDSKAALDARRRPLSGDRRWQQALFAA